MTAIQACRARALCGRASLLLPFFLCCGCGSGSRSYVPPPAAARQALEAALTAWQNGQAAGGEIKTVSPPIQMVDSGWWKGHKLASYEILNEESGDDGNRWFSVRLHLDKPSAAPVVRYLVMGRSPLWVYREEDYKRSRNWEGYK